jgi:hypothetical protein
MDAKVDIDECGPLPWGGGSEKQGRQSACTSKPIFSREDVGVCLHCLIKFVSKSEYKAVGSAVLPDGDSPYGLGGEVCIFHAASFDGAKP